VQVELQVPEQQQVPADPSTAQLLPELQLLPEPQL